MAEAPADVNVNSDAVDDDLELQAKDVCKKYENQGKEVLLLVAEPDHCQWFGTPTATQFVTEKYQFIFQFFSFCQDVHADQKNEVKVNILASSIVVDNVPECSSPTTNNKETKATKSHTIHSNGAEDNFDGNICQSETVDVKLEQPDVFECSGATTVTNDNSATKSDTIDSNSDEDIFDSNMCHGDSSETVDLKLDQPNAQSEVFKTCVKGNNGSLTKVKGGNIAHDNNLNGVSKNAKETGATNTAVDSVSDCLVRDYLENKCDNKHSCSKCGAKFIHEEHLKTHEKKRMKCDERDFVQMYTVEAIMNEEVTYAHPETGKTVNSTYQGILESQTKAELTCCCICNKKFNTLYEFKRHLIGHNKKLLYGCNICGNHYRLPNMLLYHTKQHVKKPHECEFCPKRFEHDEERNQHVLTGCQGCVKGLAEEDQVGNSLSCNQCDYKAPNQMGTSKELLCMYCGAVFQTRSGFNRHKRIHEHNAPYRCCGKLFFEKIRYQMHRCSVHGEPEEERCEICGKMFASQQQVRQHVRLVHSNQTFKCELCDREFKSKRSLQDHINKHNGTKTYKCRCGRTYRYASGLNRHKQDCPNNIHVV